MPRQNTSQQRPALLLVHGAWHGLWCWEDLLPILSRRGWRAHTVDLPSGLAPGSPVPVPVPGLYDDAATIAGAVAEMGSRLSSSPTPTAEPRPPKRVPRSTMSPI